MEEDKWPHDDQAGQAAVVDGCWEFPTFQVQSFLRRGPDDALLRWYHVARECKSLSIANGMQQHEPY